MLGVPCITISGLGFREGVLIIAHMRSTKHDEGPYADFLGPASEVPEFGRVFGPDYNPLVLRMPLGFCVPLNPKICPEFGACRSNFGLLPQKEAVT